LKNLIINMSYNIVKNVKAKRFLNNKFEYIEEKVIKEKYLDIYINNCRIQSIVTIDEDLEYLAYGSIFLGTKIEVDHILNNIKIYSNKCEIIYNDLDYNLKCCCQYEIESNKKPLLSQVETNIKPENIFKMYNILNEKSVIFKETAGLHGACIFDNDANPIYFAKDIARHNCISKIAGFLIKNKEKIDDVKFIFLSCRVNNSIVKMIERIGFSSILTKATFSYQAIEYSIANNIKLIGFIRENRFTYFS